MTRLAVFAVALAVALLLGWGIGTALGSTDPGPSTTVDHRHGPVQHP